MVTDYDVPPKAFGGADETLISSSVANCRSILADGAGAFRATPQLKFELTRADGNSIARVLNAIRSERDGVITDQRSAFAARERDAYQRELVQSQAPLAQGVAEPKRLQAATNDRALLAKQMPLPNTQSRFRSQCGEPLLETVQMGIFEPLSRGANAPSANRSIGLGFFIVRGNQIRVR